MALVSIQNLTHTFGGPPLFDGLTIHIESGQKIALLGRNGCGKSTLLKIIQGEIIPDHGTVFRQPGIVVKTFHQQLAETLTGTVEEVIAAGQGEAGKKLADLLKAERLNHDLPHREELAAYLEQKDSWSLMDQIDRSCSLFHLDKKADFETLSGGLKRRVLLSSALLGEPDLILLDEPTNHLDIEAVTQLEEHLQRSGSTLLFVTHDRHFMQNIAGRIIELDRGRIHDWECDYRTFLERREAFLEAEEKQWENFDKKLAQEEQWIRKGIKARRTRNEGRVRALLKMREQRSERRDKEQTVNVNLGEINESSKLVMRISDLSFSYGEMPIVKDFSTEIIKGDRIGIIGPNGCGKTTLIKLLLKEIEKDSGLIKHGANLEWVYYDQMRETLDLNANIMDNVQPNGDKVTIGGHTKHIYGYLQDFLFTPERARTPVGNLSGGERNRIQLAKLFTKSFNLLIMDEPTNDLDSETIELLEDLLASFQGTLLLICHDRTFLNNVVTGTLVFEGDGRIGEYAGGYDDMLLQRSPEAKDTRPKKEKTEKIEKPKQRARKRSFKENRELEELPGRLEALETERETLHAKMSDPGFYKSGEDVSAATSRLEEVDREIEEVYSRWEELESIPE